MSKNTEPVMFCDIFPEVLAEKIRTLGEQIHLIIRGKYFQSQQ